MSGSLSVYNLLTHAYQNFNNWRTIHKHALTMHLIYEKWVLFEIWKGTCQSKNLTQWINYEILGKLWIKIITYSN